MLARKENKMLNGPAVAFPAVFAGGVAGTVAWFTTHSVLLTAIATVWVAIEVGKYCYRQLQ